VKSVENCKKKYMYKNELIHMINTPYVLKWASFKVFTHILRNALIKKNVILLDYHNQLLVCFSLMKKIILWK